MKTFETKGKINFIDDNNVVVGFDNEADCCEVFGWSLTKEIPTDSHQKDIDFDYSEYQFDKTFYKADIFYNNEDTVEVYAMFRLTNNDGDELYLTLYNAHNGYYTHGFDMICDGEELYSGGV